MDLPLVGDRVLIRDGGSNGVNILEEILERTGCIYRRTPGNGGGVQPIAANVDTVFLVQALDRDFNLRRLERYMAIVREGGARPVVVLNKMDLVSDPDSYRQRVHESFPHISVHTTDALTGSGVDGLRDWMDSNSLVALLGSSGAGKSSLINVLQGKEERRTSPIRQGEGKGKGKHTTTGRQILFLDNHGMIMDTPGMRELGLLDVESGVQEAFPEIEELAAGCRFKDCQHESEPGCAVREAIEAGELNEKRLKSYRKLIREATYEQEKEEGTLHSNRKERWKQIKKDYRQMKKKR